jgi:hypothetical protein
MAESIKPTHNLTACPVCSARMELMSQYAGMVSVECKPCHFSMSMTLEMWTAAKAERDAQAPPPSEG